MKKYILMGAVGLLIIACAFWYFVPESMPALLNSELDTPTQKIIDPNEVVLVGNFISGHPNCRIFKTNSGESYNIIPFDYADMAIKNQVGKNNELTVIGKLPFETECDGYKTLKPHTIRSESRDFPGYDRSAFSCNGKRADKIIIVDFKDSITDDEAKKIAAEFNTIVLSPFMENSYTIQTPLFHEEEYAAKFSQHPRVKYANVDACVSLF